MHVPCPCHYSSCFPLNSIFGFFELRNMWHSVEFCQNCQPRMNRRTRGMRWRSVLDGQFQSARSAERLIFSTIQKDASAFNMYICQMTAWWMGKSTTQKRWGFSFTSGFAERCPLFSADLREERIRLRQLSQTSCSANLGLQAHQAHWGQGSPAPASEVTLSKQSNADCV